MRILRFTDPKGLYEGFEYMDVKVDIENLESDNCTVYEVQSNDTSKATEIGLEIPVPWVTNINDLIDFAKKLDLKLESVEDDIVLFEEEETEPSEPEVEEEENL